MKKVWVILENGEKIYTSEYRAETLMNSGKAIMRGMSDMSELLAEKERLEEANRHEYQQRGNTQKCQELWTQIEKIEKQIEEACHGI